MFNHSLITFAQPECLFGKSDETKINLSQCGDRGTVQHGAQWNFFIINLLTCYSGPNKILFEVPYYIFYVYVFIGL